MSLELETAAYAAMKKDLLSRAPGKFVLLIGQDEVGIFDRIEEAIAEGVRRVGLKPFLVRKITVEQETVLLPAWSLGVM